MLSSLQHRTNLYARNAHQLVGEMGAHQTPRVRPSPSAYEPSAGTPTKSVRGLERPAQVLPLDRVAA
jgi:hypothetical protein